MPRNAYAFCSWSGGKDSCFALHHAMEAGHKIRFLLTILGKDGDRTMSHGLPVGLVQAQALALGIPVFVRRASWDTYEEEFLFSLRLFKKKGVETGIFGDIDLQEHRDWIEKVCGSAGMTPYLPLWQSPRPQVVEGFLKAGFKATIISVKDGSLDKSFLGRTLNPELIREIEAAGVDAAGERGEFHTVVTDGPLFSAPLNLKMKDQVLRDGYWFQDVCLSALKSG